MQLIIPSFYHFYCVLIMEKNLQNFQHSLQNVNLISTGGNVISLKFQLWMRDHLVCFPYHRILLVSNLWKHFFLVYFLWLSNFLIWKANLVIVILSWLEVGFPSLYLGEELSSLWKGKSVSPTSELMCYVMWKIKTLVHGGRQRFLHNEE